MTMVTQAAQLDYSTLLILLRGEKQVPKNSTQGLQRIYKTCLPQCLLCLVIKEHSSVVSAGKFQIPHLMLQQLWWKFFPSGAVSWPCGPSFPEGDNIHWNRQLSSWDRGRLATPSRLSAIFGSWNKKDCALSPYSKRWYVCKTIFAILLVFCLVENCLVGRVPPTVLCVSTI